MMDENEKQEIPDNLWLLAILFLAFGLDTDVSKEEIDKFMLESQENNEI